MYDMPFVPDEYDIKGLQRPYPWLPSTIKPRAEGMYLVALKSQPRPLIGWYHKNHWYYLTGYEFKDEHLEETFDDFNGKIELTHWADFPPMPT